MFKKVQLSSTAYLRVQEWRQMEMETVVGWLDLKEGSEKRGGIKGFKAAGRDLNRAAS